MGQLITTILGSSTVSAIFLAVFIIVQLILKKKLRTPSDRTAEVTTVMTFMKEGVADARADRITMENTMRDLREYVSRLEKEGRDSYALRVRLEDRITELERRVREKDERIAHLEEELRKYMQSPPPELEIAIPSPPTD